MTETLRRQVAKALAGMRYGTIQLVVHDGQVVRLERLERVRLTVPTEASSGMGGTSTDASEMRHDDEE
jgi:hypothetical protein